MGATPDQVPFGEWCLLMSPLGLSDQSAHRCLEEAAARAHAGEESKTFSFFAVGVEGARMEIAPPDSFPPRLADTSRARFRSGCPKPGN